jgi:NitT/TauT family transport system substrate-binding protein
VVGWSTLALKRRAPGIVTALAALLLIVAGCSGGGEETNDASTETTPATAKDTPKDELAEPVAPKPGPVLEAADYTGVTTVKEYTYVPASRLPPLKEGSVAGYKWDAAKKTIKFPINVWPGWLPLIAANHGHKPNEESIFFKKHGFKVELVLVDDPILARDGFVAGDWPVLWCTLDMLVLFSESLMKDPRTAPRVFQQVSWSNGGDGIVVREAIKSVKDLKGKTIVYAQNSPSQYYINALLLYGGLSPTDVTSKYTSTSFEASAAFVNDRTIDACVSWAPDIYEIAKRVKGTHLLSTTSDANKLIADVWAARADFARDHPEIIRGLVEGIFEGMHEVKLHPGDACKWMGTLYGMETSDIEKMQNDARSTNFAENEQFLLNQSNPTNFESTWNSVKYVYRKLGNIDKPANFDQVMDFSVLLDIRKDGLFKDDVDESRLPDPKAHAQDPILVNTIRINFFPNSDNLFEKARDEYGNVLEDKMYDPLVKETLKRVAEMSAKFGGSRIRIVGHTDSSMKGKVDAAMVTDLSKRRAAAVKKELVKTWGFDDAKFEVEGKGWSEPADPEHPADQSKNRRVEIVILGGGK